MTDQEMYSKIQFLHFDNDCCGCALFEHSDIEQFKKVAVDFMKTEADQEISEQYRQVRVGYYKVVPAKDARFNARYHFSEKPMRGAKPVMKMVYL